MESEEIFKEKGNCMHIFIEEGGCSPGTLHFPFFFEVFQNNRLNPIITTFGEYVFGESFNRIDCKLKNVNRHDDVSVNVKVTIDRASRTGVLLFAKQDMCLCYKLIRLKKVK